MIKPGRGYVLITPEPSDSQTESGLYLPESGQEKPMKGIAVAVGKHSFQDVKILAELQDPKGIFSDEPVVGDKVIFKQWSGNSIKEDGVEYLIIKFEDILAVIE